jgi:predicted RNase H-like HicB family nuclease
MEGGAHMTRYFALLDGRRGAYGVAFPDLPGCTAMGRTIEETLRNAMEAASEWSEAVAKVASLRLFSSVAGLSGRADGEPGA